jgi:hypothetical protein
MGMTGGLVRAMPYPLAAFDALRSFAAITAKRNDGALAYLT